MIRRSSIWIIAGLLLIAAAFGIVLYNIYMDRSAETNAEEVLEELIPLISEPPPEPAPDTPLEEIIYPDYVLNPDMPMPTELIKNNWYVGVLSIPVVDLELPVMDDWNYSKLNVAPCRFYGTIYKHDMIICGHNFPVHFGKLRNLELGDRLSFTDMDGNVFDYEVVSREEIYVDDVQEMLDGEWDLTLFTCDISNRRYRDSIRCKMLDPYAEETLPQ